MNTRFTLRKKMLVLTVLPIFVLGILVIFLSLTVVKNAMVSEIEDALRSAATATFAAYDQNSGSYIEAANGDIWKGSYNISKSDSIVDSIKEKSGMEVTFFYGNRRIMTSAVDANGNRILGSPAGDKIVETVLNNGEEYFSHAVSIDGTIFYGYYTPVYQDGTASPIGMIFIGANKQKKDATVHRIIYTMIACTVSLMVLCIIISVFYSSSISRSLKKSIGVVQAVAAGNLKTSIDKHLLKKDDEVGDLSRAILQLQQEMTQSLESIADNSKAVLAASGALEGTARNTTSSIREVENAVTSIAQSASLQAQISGTASDNVAEMGKRIEQTSREMEEMKSGASAMKEAEEKNADTIRKLLDSNDEVQTLIREIATQTSQTNESAQKIKEATDIIASIADETSLLSLNASIEAARAGENGKGFAVVADQIQKLATQSNESSQRIDEIIHQLIADSDKTVETMGKVIETISAQTEHMQQTEAMTQEVMEKIDSSLTSLSVIENSVMYLDQSRNEIIKTVTELSDIAKQNAATTQEVCATVNVVTEGFSQVEGSTEGLKSIADGLEVSVEHFNV
jgi:methyl-accepting chemotaxis protein